MVEPTRARTLSRFRHSLSLANRPIDDSTPLGRRARDDAVTSSAPWPSSRHAEEEPKRCRDSDKASRWVLQSVVRSSMSGMAGPRGESMSSRTMASDQIADNARGSKALSGKFFTLRAMTARAPRRIVAATTCRSPSEVLRPTPSATGSLAAWRRHARYRAVTTPSLTWESP